MTEAAEIDASVHDNLVLYPTRPGSATIHVRALTSLMAWSPAEVRKLAADLLNRADLIDPPPAPEAAS